MVFDPQSLVAHLEGLTSERVGRYLVAFSGGCDSQVLLHAMAAIRGQLAAPLLAVHINHGLQSQAAGWAAHCGQFCSELHIPFQAIELALAPPAGESLEAVARQARYRALQALMQPGDCLLTAHHQDDQAETVLLQLFRGAGVDGLAAMPAVAPFGKGYHLRPLLGVSREQLHDYARRNGLSWVEDPSNRNQRFDRNFMRHRVLPLLAERWPGIKKTLARSAGHCAEARELVDELASRDFRELHDPADNTLDRQGLLALSPARRSALLRYWINSSGFATPPTARLHSIVHDLLEAAADRQPVVRWAGAEVRRYRGRIYLLAPLPPVDTAVQIHWRDEGPLPLPGGWGELRLRRASRGISLRRWQQGRVEVRFRGEGIKCRPAGRGGARSLKKLFQEKGVPPWERALCPLIFIDGELAAVADLLVCEPFQAAIGEQAARVEWVRSHPTPQRRQGG